VATAAFDDLSTVLSVAVLGFMAVRLVSGVRVARTRSGRRVVAAVRQRARWHHVWPVPVVLTLVVVAASVLMLVPGLDWGWWSAIGGDGNPVFGSTESTSGTAWEWVVPLLFVALLVPALPLFAHAEERMFRTGAEHWSPARRALKTLQFGLVHALIGIPIGAALALSIGGAYFMRVYLREFARSGSSNEATLQSTTAHTVYNGVIIAVVVSAVVLSPLFDGVN
jgi:hypothetical protein